MLNWWSFLGPEAAGMLQAMATIRTGGPVNRDLLPNQQQVNQPSTVAITGLASKPSALNASNPAYSYASGSSLSFEDTTPAVASAKKPSPRPIFNDPCARNPNAMKLVSLPHDSAP